MNGIASLLDETHTARVEALWHALEKKCGLTGVKMTPFPHFTYQVVADYDLPHLETILQVVARQSQPFTIRTAGLGLFTGPTPIVHIVLVKDERLLNFHKMLWEQTWSIAVQPSPYYAPAIWTPHITLAYGDVTRANLDCVMQILAFEPFDWEIRIDTLVYIAQSGEQTYDNCCCYRFGE
jgi:2'-5' RNA ligase